MLGLKATLITAAIGFSAATTLAFLWKSEQVKSARLAGELSQAVANTEALKQAVADQKSAFEKMASLAHSNDQRLDQLMQDKDNAQQETQKLIAKINGLRATEANRALQEPFGRGNIARERFTHSMQRIANAKSGTSTNSNHSNPAESR